MLSEKDIVKKIDKKMPMKPGEPVQPAPGRCKAGPTGAFHDVATLNTHAPSPQSPPVQIAFAGLPCHSNLQCHNQLTDTTRLDCMTAEPAGPAMDPSSPTRTAENVHGTPFAAPEIQSPFLITTPARRQDRLHGLVIVLVSSLFFVLLAPYATVPLAPMPGFIGVYQSSLIVIQLLVALLFFAKFHVLRLPALLYLASAYLFSGLMAIVHGLTFPGLFQPTGLLKATPQSTAWLYMFWHTGFPLLLMAYARKKNLQPHQSTRNPHNYRPILWAIGAVSFGVLLFTLLATLGSDLLPAIMVGNKQYYPTMKPVVVSVCALSLLALVMLWKSRPHNVMDIWLMVVCTTWIFDIALAAILNAARFDTGFYFGRLYGLIAAGVILGVLLFESTKMYGQLVKAHARDLAINEELQKLYLKAQELDKLKTSFFANMSHEIRTPMNAILGITHLLRRQHPTPQQLEHLDKISMASQHLLSVINDILDFSKIESGAMLLENENFPISAVLDHTRSLIEDSAQAKGLTISIDYGNCPHWLIGDQTRLRQAMLNFAGNAVKFTDNGHIELKCALIEQDDAKVLIRFEVKDTGIGIPAEAIPELFHAFKQVDASTTRKYGGTGLGLVITQRLASLMGGTAGVESQPGQGSRFWFTARLNIGSPIIESKTSNPEQKLLQQHAGIRILLTEDDPINQEIARVLLTEAGMQVTLANNGQEALNLSKAQAFDLILMDVQMPVMDGIEASRQIRMLPERQQVPILALTANIFEEDRRRCRAAGMNDLIGKPVDPQELFNAILKSLPNAGTSPLPTRQALDPESVAQQHSHLKSHLLAVDGLDLDPVLSRMHGDVSRLWSLLQKFVTLHAQDMPELRQALQQQQITTATRLAHTLKGVAGTLGLTRLQADAQQLEALLLAGQLDLEPLIEQIARQQQDLAQAVHDIASQQT